jgi:hypothetical protein
MSEEAEPLQPLQQNNISAAIKKLYKTERIVNYDLDFSKWEVKKLYNTTLWIQLIDEPDADTIQKGLLTIPVQQAKGLYRIGRVLMAGPEVKHAQVGEYIRFPQGVGSPYEVKVGGYKTWLLREEQVMMVVEPPFQDEEKIRQHVEETILSA